MKVIGLTGGLACGKTSVSAVFAENQIAVIDADEIASRVVKPGNPAYRAILKVFGDAGVSLLLPGPGRELDRKKLREIVFSDVTGEKRKLLNQCTHKWIALRIAWELFYHYATGMRAVILDAPLLFESGLDKICSITVVVWCPEKTQIERLKKRDGVTEEQARQLIGAQWPTEEKKRLADYVLDNSGAPQATELQIKRFIFRHEPHWPWTFVQFFFPPVAILSALYVLVRNLWRSFRRRGSARQRTVAGKME